MNSENIHTVGVLGAGTMGNGIAHVFARSGYSVILRDIERTYLDRALDTIGKNLDREVKKGKITEADKAASLGRISAVTDVEALREADFAVEAVRAARTEDQCAEAGGCGASPGRSSIQQYIFDLGDHACGANIAAGGIHRHAFHESGSRDATGGSDQSDSNVGGDVRADDGALFEAGEKPGGGE